MMTLPGSLSQLRKDPFKQIVPDVHGGLRLDDHESGWGNLPVHVLETIYAHFEAAQDVGCAALVSKRWSLGSPKARVRAITRAISPDDFEFEPGLMHPIMVAAKQGNVDVVRIMLENGLRVDTGVFDSKDNGDGSMSSGLIREFVARCGAPEGIIVPDDAYLRMPGRGNATFMSSTGVQTFFSSKSPDEILNFNYEAKAWRKNMPPCDDYVATVHALCDAGFTISVYDMERALDVGHPAMIKAVVEREVDATALELQH
jgi:hypothetical protein